ncbi:FAD/FMN-containing dehydrogenase [Planoprotostelium fungivorum]|uniref:FAD/FMN-containing dehydrogenase n=1 Tax=Planoprotostelium fungivorum TaxID=1890364 RepID=A0A2P6NZ51_9EUKA|nr:FAD/FMN-containing dehydrogenase [Planoprotostelium fungivorum]
MAIQRQSGFKSTQITQSNMGYVMSQPLPVVQSLYLSAFHRHTQRIQSLMEISTPLSDPDLFELHDAHQLQSSLFRRRLEFVAYGWDPTMDQVTKEAYFVLGSRDCYALASLSVQSYLQVFRPQQPAMKTQRGIFVYLWTVGLMIRDATHSCLLTTTVGDTSSPKSNWNLNQGCEAQIYHPSDLEEIVRIVRTSDRVRVAGYGHSWSPIIATNNDVGYTLIDLKKCRKLKKILSSPQQVRSTSSVTFECATSVQELEDWLRSNNVPLTLPSNVVLTEVFLVGLTACICHGAGYEWGSVSDMVRSVTLVNHRGEVITYTDQDPTTLPLSPDIRSRARMEVISTEEMNHMRGSFGLFGVIYCMTISLSPAHTVRMTDRVVPLETVTDPVQLKSIVEKYNGWLEIFWVPTTEEVWLKTWERAPDHEWDAPEHQSSDVILGNLGQFLYNWWGGCHGGKVFLGFIWKMMALDFKKKPLVSHYHWFDAIHYRDYIDDFPVENTDFAIPVEDDYVSAARGFQIMIDVARQMEEESGLYPINIACEMRFTRGSDVTLAHFPSDVSQRYVQMEFLRSSLMHIRDDRITNAWKVASERITEKWIDLGGLPHWAKGWHNIPNITNIMKEKVIRQNFVEFRREMDPSDKFLTSKFRDLLENGPVGRMKKVEEEVEPWGGM